MQERRRQPEMVVSTVAVVDDHRTAGEEHVRMHQSDHAVRRRGDPGAGGRRDVDFPEYAAERWPSMVLREIRSAAAGARR